MKPIQPIICPKILNKIKEDWTVTDDTDEYYDFINKDQMMYIRFQYYDTTEVSVENINRKMIL